MEQFLLFIALGGCLYLVVRLLKPKPSGSCHTNACDCEEPNSAISVKTNCQTTQSEETASTVP